MVESEWDILQKSTGLLWELHNRLLKFSRAKIALCKKDKKLAKALHMYKGPWFSVLNGALRKDQALDKDCQYIDSTLQALMDSCPTDILLYRSIDGAFAENIANLKIGQTFTELGYSSTSFDAKSALNFDSTKITLLVIHPERSKCIYIDGFRDIYCKDRWPYQAEVLLNKNSTFRIIKKEPTRNIVFLNAAFGCKESVAIKRTVKTVHIEALI